MFFKTVTAYHLGDNLPNAATINKKLQARPVSELLGLDWFAEGFAPPQPFSQELVFDADGVLSLRLQRQEKVLPSSVLNEQVNKKVAEIEAAENRRVGRKERAAIKEQITDDLLPSALIRSRNTFAMIKDNWLLINAPQKQAENLITKLREALGGLEARLPNTQLSPTSLMTDWLLQGTAAGNFKLDCDCELRALGVAAAVVKVSKQDLTEDEVVQHVKNGKSVTQLGLVWRDQIAFILTADLTLKRVQYLDVLQQEVAQQGEDAATLAFASQLLAAQSLTTLLNELADHLGGFNEKV